MGLVQNLEECHKIQEDEYDPNVHYESFRRGNVDRNSILQLNYYYYTKSIASSKDISHYLDSSRSTTCSES